MRKAGIILVVLASSLLFMATASAEGADPIPGPNDWYTFTNPGGQVVCHQGDPSIGTSNLTFVGGPFTTKPPECGGSTPSSTTTATTEPTTTVTTSTVTTVTESPTTTTQTETPTTTTEVTTEPTVPSETTTATTPPTTQNPGGNGPTGPIVGSVSPPKGSEGPSGPQGTGKLAFTGVEDVVPIGAAALLLLTLGSGLMWAGRKKED
jgi:hypothetical protein